MVVDTHDAAVSAATTAGRNLTPTTDILGSFSKAARLDRRDVDIGVVA
jgi:hypothetical protein